MEKVEPGWDEIEPFSTAVLLTRSSFSSQVSASTTAWKIYQYQTYSTESTQHYTEIKLPSPQLVKCYVAKKILFLDGPLQNSMNKI